MPKRKDPVSPDPHLGSLELTEGIIRQRAYLLFEQRGYEHGHDFEDWLQAEAEIMGTKNPVVSSSEEPKARRAAVA